MCGAETCAPFTYFLNTSGLRWKEHHFVVAIDDSGDHTLLSTGHVLPASAAPRLLTPVSSTMLYYFRRRGDSAERALNLTTSFQKNALQYRTIASLAVTPSHALAVLGTAASLTPASPSHQLSQ